MFVGCESESERGYAALLQKFANERDLAVHIEAKVLARAGDPLALAKKAAVLIEQGSRKPKSRYAYRFLIFDTDRLGLNPKRDFKFIIEAKRVELVLIRQNKCFESFLLRHFNGHENGHPSSSSDALNRLRQVWPEYKKGCSALELSRHFQLSHVQRASVNPLNADYAKLLESLGIRVPKGTVI
ncbi:MAG: RloB domain-containing protein [Albidovulum sp.]|nr:RloB domain-containing protein [Albidovulum sp.]